MSGHLLCRDTFSMYGLFYHVNDPLIRGQRCVGGKTMLYRGFGYKAAARGNAIWTCLNLLRIALTILKKQVNNVNERVSTCCLTLPPTSIADVGFT